MYLALYRKYRPRTFDDVISQGSITAALKNQVENQNTVHAYLFTGSRGTGKTSCAKILAMAVNCLNPRNGNPCLECERCREILSGETTDIVEMDAASNNGVDDVRRLRDEVAYAPISCKYRVYIIDEVHMLSQAAFNALLKTLEEPPEHIKFILATTELQKVPTTIVSRCQRFEFKRVDTKDSVRRLQEVALKENAELDDSAAELISRLSDGGMRDALSLLDRCISVNEHVTLQLVRDCAGVVDKKHLFAFSEMAARHDVGGCVSLLNELYALSKDIALLINELAVHFRDLMLYKTVPNNLSLLSALPDEYGDIARCAELYDINDIFRCLSLLGECADGISKTKQRKILAEMCLVKMCLGTSPQAGEARTQTRITPQPAYELKKRDDDFITKSPEEMNERQRLIAKQTRELENKMGINRQAPPENTAKESHTSPEDNSAPPWDEAPPLEEAPPLSEKAEQSAEGLPAEAVQPPIEKPVEIAADNPPENPKSAPKTTPDKITAEQWNETISRMDTLGTTLFADSTATLADGVLRVESANKSLVENIKDEAAQTAAEKISELLGFPITLKIVPLKTEDEFAEEDMSGLEKLAAKARRLGIEVQYKNN